MQTALVGHTGFVGGNLAQQERYDSVYNSSNIGEIDGREFDLLVCAGVRAVKWWANQNADADRESVEALLRHLRRVKAREVVAISTIDVYPDPRGVDEATPLDGVTNHAYGTNRLFFENELRSVFSLVRVVRLPGLFGAGLKKNVIFDLVHNNGLEKINPDSVFQYYDLARLSQDIRTIRNLHLELVNLATEPVPTRSIVTRFFPGVTVGQSALPQACYDMRSRHAAALGGSGSYLENAPQVLDRLGNFLEGFRMA